MSQTLSDWIHAIVNENPLIHCITNRVSANFQANALLALGASPIMTDEVTAVANLVRQSQALVINVGSPFNEEKQAAIHIAMEAANQAHIPVVLDPVGIAALPNRLAFVQTLLSNYQFAAICGNYSEMAALAALNSQGKGVDGGQPDGDLLATLHQLSRQYHCTLVATGKVDYIVNELHSWSNPLGSPLFQYVTGTGCVATTMVAAFISQANSLEEIGQAAFDAISFYTGCGQEAAALSQGPGDFSQQLLNQIYRYSVHAVADQQIFEKLSQIPLNNERM